MTWTIRKASVEFGVSRDTITKGLIRDGTAVRRNHKYTTRQIVAAIHGDLKFERTRLIRAQADAIEVENRKADGELISKSEVDALLHNREVQLMERINALADEQAHKVNPENDKHAYTVLAAWSAETRKIMRGA